MKEPLVPPRHSTSSSSPPPYTPRCSNGFIIKTEEEEDRLVCLEKRLEPNVDFDDALQVLDSTRISNLEQPWMGAILYGVGVNTHKELDSEVLMTLALVINEGVSCLSFRLEDEEQLVPYGYIGELLSYKKEDRSKLMSKKNVRSIFGE
jgi:hypothetical protein